MWERVGMGDRGDVSTGLSRGVGARGAVAECFRPRLNAPSPTSQEKFVRGR